MPSISTTHLQVAGLLALIVALIRVIVRRARLRSIAHLPGPAPGSWLVGNLPELISPDNAADAEFAWVNAYGSSLRVKGAFGNDVLLTADPKAFQYILNTSGYNYPKPQQKIATSRLTTGRGLTYAQGAQHARQRKIMNPAFSYGSLRVFLPLFRSTTQKTVSKWKDIIADSGTPSSVLDVKRWLERTTLDAMGVATCNHDFGTIENHDNELSRVFSNLFIDSFFKRSDITIAFEALWGYVPLWLVPVIQTIPTKRLRRLNEYMRVSRRVAKAILDEQVESHAKGKEGGKDVMSILIKANISENPKTKLDDDEVLSQLTTVMVGGHETTASTVTWTLYELSRHMDFQRLVREEIKETRAKAAQRGDAELGVSDLDSMKYMLALMKESLRYHPIVLFLYRIASRNDVIPLLEPQKTLEGDLVTSIPVSKGQKIMLSIPAYNRLKSVWGEDAHVWRPERFLEEEVDHKQKTGLGVYANLASFGSGLRACIGWRFALIEMQAILIELIENFEFSPAPGNVEIIRAATNIMTPMVKGSTPCRTELPLTVTPVF